MSGAGPDLAGPDLAGAALLIIDLQLAVDDPSWAVDGPRNNPQAEVQVAALAAGWRARGAPIFHIRHDSIEPHSTYYPGAPGHAFKPEGEPHPGEPVIAKHAHSAFVGTGLEVRLRRMEVRRLVVCGVITNNSVEATVRHGADLGFDIVLAQDACFTFARRDARGTLWAAEDVHALSLANLAGEYCQVSTTEALLAHLAA